MNIFIRRSIVISVCLALTGCGWLMRSDYQSPSVDMPDKWEVPQSAPTSAASSVANSVANSVTSIPDAWWRTFGDPQLDALIDQALASNNDLAAAAIRVRRARLQAGLADTNVWPDISVGGNAGVSRDLNHGGNTRSYNATASVSYEVDLWGRLAAVRDAAKWEADATEQDRQAAALSLVGTTASLYWQIAYLHQRIASSEASIEYVRQTLALTQTKYDAGKVSRLDVAQAEQNLQAQQADHTQLLQQLAQARHAMGILFDRSPQYRVPELAQLPTQPLPDVAAGIPAEVLARRPDLQAAQMRLRETLANVDQTRASFLPTFTLTGSVGGTSTALADVLRNPIGTLGAGLVLPFVQWNTMQLSIKVSQTQYEEAVVNFRQTLYKALADVEDSLSASTYYQSQGAFLNQSLTYAREAESISKTRYEAGKTDVQSWIDQQDRRRAAENSLAQNQLDQLNNRMKLYQALGGGDDKAKWGDNAQSMPSS